MLLSCNRRGAVTQTPVINCAYQLLTKVVSEFRNQVHEAEKGVCLCMGRNAGSGVPLEEVVQGCVELVHALHVRQTRVELGKDEKRPLHFLFDVHIHHVQKPSTPPQHTTSLCSTAAGSAPLKKCMSGCVRMTSRSICSRTSASLK